MYLVKYVRGNVITVKHWKSNIKEKYYFNFLCPSDYTAYFQYIKDGRIFISNFHGILEDELEKEDNNRYS